MKTKLIILGCGSSIGVPRIDNYWGKCNKNNKKNRRSRCSAIIIKDNNLILIDTSPDLKNQLLVNKIKNISSVIYSHDHADQTHGIFELRPFYWKNNKKIDVYGNKQTIISLKKRFSYLFENVGTYRPFLKPHIIKKSFSLGERDNKVNFKTIIVKHGRVKTVGYIFENTAYLSDCNDLSIINMKQLKNLKYLILDCLRVEKAPTHFILKEALYVHSILKPKKTILTNLSLQFDYKNLTQKLPFNVHVAYDGLKLIL